MMGFLSSLRMSRLRSRRYRWAARTVLFLAGLALLADFLANDKPLYCVYEGRTYFPVFSGQAARMGWTDWPDAFHRGDWHALSFDRVVRTPVPYGPGYLDLRNARFAGPWDDQDVASVRYRHWLGTDALGRDVLAGMIHGTRTALLVGLLGTAIAFFLALWPGGWTGFYGDERLKAGPFRIGGVLLALPLAWFYLFRTPLLSGLEGAGRLAVALIAGGLWILLLSRAGGWMDRKWRTRPLTVPVDLLGMRVIEAIQAMPGLLLLLAMIPLFASPSVWNVVLITGLIRWPGMARFLRAELLRIRELPYIESARLSGIPEYRLLWRHALPNALPPLLVLMAFSISAGVLLEAFLSFLGLGVPPDQVTWGSLLQAARRQFSAWWLAVFPGIGIFLTVTAFNLLGEALQDRLDTRKPYLPLNEPAP